MKFEPKPPYSKGKGGSPAIRITIRDVARTAGVSVSTVSRVLNNSKPVSDEVRQRVMSAVETLGFQPNALARSLILRRSSFIGLLVPDVSNPFFSEVVAGVEEVANAQGYNVILCNTHGELAREMAYLDILKEHQAAGVVFMCRELRDEHLKRFAADGMPVVLASRYSEKKSLPRVVIDDQQAAYDATIHLIERGHQRIAFISGSVLDRASGLDRLMGYQRALNDHQFPIDFRLIKEGNFKAQSGYKAAQELLGQQAPPTAILAANDEMAIGAINAIFASGRRVPDDIAVVGFDDIYLASIFRPALTTIRQPIREIGSEAAQMVLRLVRGESLPDEKVVLPHELVIRESSV